MCDRRMLILIALLLFFDNYFKKFKEYLSFTRKNSEFYKQFIVF